MKKIKTLAISLLLVGAVITAIVVIYNIGETNRLSQSDLADKIRDLESKIDDVESNNSILQSRLGDLESKVDDLDSRLDDLDSPALGKVHRLKRDIEDLDSKIKGLELSIRQDQIRHL